MPDPTFAGALADPDVLRNVLSHLTIRETLNLRFVSRATKSAIDTGIPAQEKLFFAAVVPAVPPPLPTYLELNPLLFARRHVYILRNTFQFYEHPGGFYELHLQTGRDQEKLLNRNWKGCQAMLTRPSLTSLQVNMRGYKPAPFTNANQGTASICWIAWPTVNNANGVTYGDVLREAVRECRRQGQNPYHRMTFEVRFPPGHKLRLGPYEEVLGALDDQHRARLGL
ncbi:hypothetical protein PRZ48_008890 [Zasmidium cellare]|uniref:F-box domain-containing protein n=1 Tax=Zasmidium cellare TaxID=395010 RepID=A0ABR0EGR9_ZASCE|nr:hypothetical protein PRZ48_008890 [Zasmidium cellare]